MPIVFVRHQAIQYALFIFVPRQKKKNGEFKFAVDSITRKNDAPFNIEASRISLRFNRHREEEETEDKV